MFFPGIPESEKIRKIRECGFDAAEFWSWKGKNIGLMADACEEHGVTIPAFCLEPNYCYTGTINETEIAAEFKASTDAAEKLGCECLIVTVGNGIGGEEPRTTRGRLVRNLRFLGKLAHDSGITLVVEPLNVLTDHAGYFLTRMDDAASLIADADSKSLKILMDLYHQQITEGSIISNIEKYARLIGHFHAAGVPGRHELMDGELNYKTVTAAIAKTGFDGFVGLEYRPVKESAASLIDARRYFDA
jgi:hydroxypyruvate isomerase